MTTTIARSRTEQISMDAMQEFRRATGLFGRFHSAHEGFAVLLEEVEELKAEVFKKDRDVARMREEAIQIAAMGMRFVLDICDEVKL